MSPKTHRYFLIGILAVAGIAVLSCIAILTLGSSLRDRMDICISIAFSVGFCLLLAFAALTALDRPYWKYPAGIGMTLAVLSIIIFPICIVVEAYATSRNQSLWRWPATCMLSASLFCLVPWVGAMRIKSLGRLLQLLAIASMLGSYAIFLSMIWDWIHGGEEMDVLLFTFFILTGGSSVATFALYKFFGLKLPDPLTTIDQTLFVCPRCLKEQELPMGESHCVACKLQFKIEVEEPKCPNCGYSLRALTHPICPECGRTIVPNPVPAEVLPSI
jgi:hypothetical protein